MPHPVRGRETGKRRGRPARAAACACVCVAALAVLAGCLRRETVKRVDLQDVEQAPALPPQASDSSSILRVAIASMISPNNTRLLYKDLVDYIGRRLGRKVILKQRRTYGEVNELLARDELDLAFLCSAPYVEARDKLGVRLLAVPVVRGQAVYKCYIIVRARSTISTLEGLRGKKFAFVDPMSNTGYLVPTYLLVLRGESPESFFASCTYTGSHDNSIQAVAEGFADGAAVDSLTYDFLQTRGSPLVRSTRVIYRSGWFGIPPFVVPAKIDPALETKLRAVLVSMHQDARGKEILGRLDIERFIAGDDKAYDAIRRMKALLKDKARHGPGSPRGHG